MAAPIAISVAFDELVRPDAPEYSGFFDMLRAEGRRTQPLDALTDDSLREFGALLLGAPRDFETLCASDVGKTLRRWVSAGGALLVLIDTFGHDELTLLEAFGPLVDTFVATSWSVGEVSRDAAGQVRWQTCVPLDVSVLIGQSAILGLDAGSILVREPQVPSVSGASVLRETLPVPEGVRAIPLASVDVAEPDLAHIKKDFDPELRAPPAGVVYSREQLDRGTVSAFTAPRSLRNDGLARDDTVTFVQWMLRRWLPDHARDEVRARMERPQRHRMLHAYPMAPLTPPLDDATRAPVEALATAPLPAGHGIVVGVLPHPFCNPSVRGCGFCTFPHEAFSQPRAHEVTSRVVAEIDAFRARAPSLAGQRVEALYLGGGTANLTPPDDLVAIGQALARTWDLRDAEVTLEGVPVYFTARDAAMLDALERAFPSSRRRLSLGVQTLDPSQIARMGRRAFGDRAVIEGVAMEAHARGMAVSADLLFDLPGQTLAQMLADVDDVIAMGFDQVCLYHLVLFEGLGTEWSHDRSLLAALPDNARACAHWIELREHLTGRGFVQTSLTNFERRAAREGGEGFRYEACAYAPERYDIVGFGPAALTGRFTPSRAVKVVNVDGADAYVRAADAGDPRSKGFVYGPRDARILYLTRKVVTLGFERAAYRALFGTDAVADFAMDFEALSEAGLVRIDDARVSLTEQGMFYADTVAGQLASRQVHDRRVRAGLALGRPTAPRPMRLAADAAWDAMG